MAGNEIEEGKRGNCFSYGVKNLKHLYGCNL